MQRYGPLRIAPFGNPRIEDCLRLPTDYRGLPRPSSPVAAKASVMRPNSLPANKIILAAMLVSGKRATKSRAPACCNARPPHGERAALTCGFVFQKPPLSLSNRMIYSFTFNIVRIAKELTEMVGAPGLEPETSSLSETRSNQLSYAPALHSEKSLFH